MLFHFSATVAQQMFGGPGAVPSNIDPALANRRQRQKIIRQLKQDFAPYGTGLLGAYHGG